MPKKIAIEESIVIDTSIEAVWKTSADDFAHIDRWDANVKTSHAQGEASTEAKVGGRVCSQYNGSKTVENIVAFDAQSYSFTYAITEGLPGFVVSARNTWIHERISDDRTKLNMLLVMEVKGFLGSMMQVPMRSQMRKVLRNAQEELKHFIETGEQHPRKVGKK